MTKIDACYGVMVIAAALYFILYMHQRLFPQLIPSIFGLSLPYQRICRITHTGYTLGYNLAIGIFSSFKIDGKSD